ncbi:1419_t:CDS:2, partial [Acaulospora morrowiae]
MYTQPPPSSQQPTQRPISNQPQSQPLTSQPVSSSTPPIQQNFPGWRPVGGNAQPFRPPPPPQNVRPGFLPGQRPPQTVAAPGTGPMIQGQPQMIAAAQSQPPQVNTFPGSRPPMIQPSSSAYPQSTISSLPTRPPGPPGPMRPPQRLDVGNMDDIVNQVGNIEINPGPPSIQDQPQLD